MTNEVQTMPTLTEMTKTIISYEGWVNYYLNVWNSVLIGRISDVVFDERLNPEAETNEEIAEMNSSGVTEKRKKLVKERLLERRFAVQNAVQVVQSLSDMAEILAKEDGEKRLTEKYIG